MNYYTKFIFMIWFVSFFNLLLSNDHFFSLEEYKKLKNFLLKERQILIYCEPCGDKIARKVTIYKNKISYKDKKIQIMINDLPIPPENIYVNYSDKETNLVYLSKMPNFDIMSNPKYLEPNQIAQKIYSERMKENSDVFYLKVFEKELLDEINLLRQNPQEYIKYLENRLVYYLDDKKFIIPGEVYFQTLEGKVACLEAIEVLKNTKSMGLLDPSENLTKAALDHIKDTGPKGIVGHYGSDGSSPYQRVHRYSKEFKYLGEVISYGIFDPREIVIQFLIDDGVKDRGHRKSLLNPLFKEAGVSCGDHRDFGIMCTVDLGTR